MRTEIILGQQLTLRCRRPDTRRDDCFDARGRAELKLGRITDHARKEVRLLILREGSS